MLVSNDLPELGTDLVASVHESYKITHVPCPLVISQV